MTEDFRPNPDELLKSIQRRDGTPRGYLKIFLGMSAGVGKTYTMLEEAQLRSKLGKNVVVGLIETHGRKETQRMLGQLRILPRKKVLHRGVKLEEMDLDLILSLKPDLVLVDELAHTNAPGSRHPKRWQDVIELIENGINVFTTLNIQHLESKKDDIESITNIKIHETVPDSVLERANIIEVIDLSPEDLLQRLATGNVYFEEKANQAKENFFKAEKLMALRQILLRYSADRIDYELQHNSDFQLSGRHWKTQEKLLLAVGHGPQSEKLVRLTKQMAHTMNCPWYAVHINTGVHLNQNDAKKLSANLDLARELGARVLTSSDTNIAEGVDRICQQYQISQVVVGKPGFHPFDFIFGGSILAKLNRLNNQVAIHLVRLEDSRTNFFFLTRLKDQLLKTNWGSYFLATLYVVILAIFNKLIFINLGILPYRSVGMIFLMGVIFCGLIFPMGATIWASLLTVQVWNVFFIPPLYTFFIASTDDIALAISFFFTATVTGALTSVVKKNQILLRDQEKRTSELFKFSQLIAESKDKNDCIEKMSHSLSRFFDAQVGISLKTSDGVLDYFKRGEDWHLNQPKEWAAALWCFENQKISGRGTSTLPEASAFFIPLIGKEGVIGVIGISPNDQKKALSLPDKEFAFSVSSQAALYLEREIYHERALESQKLKESERMHQTLLNSVSHELKTPLTSIQGAVEAIQYHPVLKNQDDLEDLSANIVEGVARLKRIIDNILDVSRLESGVLALKYDWFILNDLVENVFDSLSEELKGFDSSTDISEDFPLVYVDGKLIEQVLYNIILNSIKYSGEKKVLRIKSWFSSDYWFLEIQDFGKGVPKEYEQKVFEKFFRVPGTQAGGSGLGLNLCRSIVELHRGVISCQSQDVGFSVIIKLPMRDQPQLDKENLL